MSGWLKLHRNILEWEWYSDLPTRVVFMHLLLIVNREPSTYQGVHVPKAGKAIGRKQLAMEVGLTDQQVRRALANLQNTGDITIKTTNKFSVVTIVHWEEWQDQKQKQPAEEPTDDHQNNQQTTTEQEEINNKNISLRARGISPRQKSMAPEEAQRDASFEIFWDAFPRQRRGGKAKARTAWYAVLRENRAETAEIMEGLRRYSASSEVARGYAKGATAWLNDDRWKNQYFTIEEENERHSNSSKGNHKASITDRADEAQKRVLAEYGIAS